MRAEWALVALAALVAAGSRLMPRVKAGVVLGDGYHVLEIRNAIYRTWARHGLPVPVITSSYRADDAGAHGRNEAEDYRTFNLPDPNLRFALAADGSRELGPLYQAIVEDGPRRWYYRAGVFEGYRDDRLAVPQHLHLEYDGGG